MIKHIATFFALIFTIFGLCPLLAIAQNYPVVNAASNDVLAGWPVSNLDDGNPATAYSSGYFPNANNSRNTYIAAWAAAGPVSVNTVILTARMYNGLPNGFPAAYNIYLTTPTNSNWMVIGHYTTQPNADGVATIQLPATYTTYGVFIIPTALGVDAFNNHYFQMAEIGIAYQSSNAYVAADTAAFYTDLAKFPLTNNIMPVAATASSSYGGYPPTNVFNYANPIAAWNSGTGQPSWIMLDFGSPQLIATLQLVVLQSPNGAAHHQIFSGNNPSALTEVLDIPGSFQNNEIITVHMPAGAPAARYIMIKTLSTVSWAAWGHISAFPPHAPSYLGFYDSAATNEFVDATPTVSRYSNTTWISGPSINADVALLQEAQNLNMKAVLSVQTLFFAGCNLLPLSQYYNNWLELAPQLAQYMNNGTLVSFYPFDEPYGCATSGAMTYAQMESQLETVASVIKTSFPQAKIMMLFTINDFATLQTQSIIPSNYDFIGFDCYGSWTSCGGHDIPWYVGQIENHLSAVQKVVIFPDTSIFVPVPATIGYDAYWIRDEASRLLQYFDLAQADPNIVGVFGFLYQNYAADGKIWLGANDPTMAPVLTEWQLFSNGIMHK